jgi:transposase
LTDDEWELIADVVAPYWKPGRMGRPVTVPRRRVVDAIFYVAATGCQWRALPGEYPNWNTVHRYHLAWSRDGTWEKIAHRLAAAVRENEGREPEPSAGVVDARSVRGASTVTTPTRGYDAGKKISGRKTFGIVDTLGLLVAVLVVAADTSDNTGGIAVADRARTRSARFAKLWCDAGFKRTFLDHCRRHHVAVEVVNRIHPHTFVALPQRWIVERTWSWLINNRRLQIDYERDPIVTEGFIWAAHSRYLLRRLTQPQPPPPRRQN